jgi:hypothetical protein
MRDGTVNLCAALRATSHIDAARTMRGARGGEPRRWQAHPFSRPTGFAVKNRAGRDGEELFSDIAFSDQLFSIACLGHETLPFIVKRET